MLVASATGARSLVVSRASPQKEYEPKTGVGYTKLEEVDMSQYPPCTRLLTKEDCEVQFVRSQGAGGQNVNKVNTKADLRFDFMKADFIPDWVKENIFSKEANKINSEGYLFLQSQRHRTQKQNYEDAVAKMQALIDLHAQPPNGPSKAKIKKVEKLAKKANQKRLEQKKKISGKKNDRRNKGKGDW